jgi:hypothetical protein
VADDGTYRKVFDVQVPHYDQLSDITDWATMREGNQDATEGEAMNQGLHPSGAASLESSTVDEQGLGDGATVNLTYAVGYVLDPLQLPAGDVVTDVEAPKVDRHQKARQRAASDPAGFE